MTQGRSSAAAIVYKNSLYISGGLVYPSKPALQSTEIIHANGTITVGVDLPQPLYLHAITSVNESFSIFTGGNKQSNLTWYYNHVTDKFILGPHLREGRNSHAAGTLIDHGTNMKIPVVTGGIGAMNGQLNSTEFLINGEWLKGKKRH